MSESNISIRIDEIKSYVEQYEDFKISNKITADTAATIIKEIRLQCKELEDWRKRMTKPLDESKREIMNLFKNPISKLEILKTYLDKMMLEYLNNLEEENRDRERKAEETIRKLAEEKVNAEVAGNIEDIKEVETKLNTIAVNSQEDKPEGITYSLRWEVEITDESLVPDKFKKVEIDMKALKSLVVQLKGKVTIPGVKFYQKKSLMVRK